MHPSNDYLIRVRREHIFEHGILKILPEAYLKEGCAVTGAFKIIAKKKQMGRGAFLICTIVEAWEGRWWAFEKSFERWQHQYPQYIPSHPIA